MGNTQSDNIHSENNITNEIQEYDTDILDLFKEINKYCLALTSKYKGILLDTSDSNQLAIVLENSLKKLPLAQLKDLNKKLSYNVYVKKNQNRKLNVTSLKITKELKELSKQIEKGDVQIKLKNIDLVKYHYLFNKHHVNQSGTKKRQLNKAKPNIHVEKKVTIGRRNHIKKGGDTINETYTENEEVEEGEEGYKEGEEGEEG
jgi:hypothetical protein